MPHRYNIAVGEIRQALDVPNPTARHAIFEFIEVFYNRQRLHSSLGYLGPAEYEARRSGQAQKVEAG